jgi:hypothetical protein
MSLVETLLKLYTFAHLMFSGRLFIRCIYRVIMIISFIYQWQSKFVHVKEDQKHEILEYPCYLSGAICTITTNVTNDDYSAHETRYNEIFMDIRIKNIILYSWSFTCSMVTSFTLKMVTAGLKVTLNRSPALYTWVMQYSTSISSYLHAYFSPPIQHKHA